MSSRRLRVVLMVLTVVVPLFAQETTAGIQGSVRDPSGSVISNATVEVSGPALIGARKVKTDDAGNYHVAALAPGEYTITVTAPGFHAYRQTGIDLTVGRLPNIDVQLQVGTVTETVEVTGESVAID